MDYAEKRFYSISVACELCNWFTKNTATSTQPTFLSWRFGLYQRPSSEEVCSIPGIPLPVLATIVMRRGKKSVVRVAQHVAALVPRFKDCRPSFRIIYQPKNMFYEYYHCLAFRCMGVDVRSIILMHTTRLSNDYFFIARQSRFNAHCKVLECCNPWPHVANRRTSISQLLSLWRHSYYDVIRASRAFGARSPRSHYDVIRYWGGHTQRYGRTYGHLAVFKILLIILLSGVLLAVMIFVVFNFSSAGRGPAGIHPIPSLATSVLPIHVSNSVRVPKLWRLNLGVCVRFPGLVLACKWFSDKWFCAAANVYLCSEEMTLIKFEFFRVPVHDVRTVCKKVLTLIAHYERYTLPQARTEASGFSLLVNPFWATVCIKQFALFNGTVVCPVFLKRWCIGVLWPRLDGLGCHLLWR